MCNVIIQLNEEVLAAYLCEYGDIEDITKAKANNGTEHGDYIFTMCLDRAGFAAIPHTLEYESHVMTVVIVGRKPQCWNCKQLGHFSKSCPQKTTKTIQPTTTTATTVTIVAAAVTTRITKASSESPKSETGDHPDKEEGWTQVQKGGKKKTPIKKPTENQTTNPITATTVLLSLLFLLLLQQQNNSQHHQL